MRRKMHAGQTTAEFAIVFSVFALLIFGVIEVGRAVYEKQALARAAETVAHTLAQDPSLSWSTGAITPTVGGVNGLINTANQNAALGLNTTFPDPAQTQPITGFYDLTSGLCLTSGGDPNQTCEVQTNVGNQLAVIGLPDLTTPLTVTVAITVPYHSYLAYPLQFLRGQAEEIVSATTRCGQDSQAQDCPH